MVRDDPDASIIQEALENYAYGVLDTQNEVAQFLERKGLIIKRRAKNRTKNGMSVIHHSFVGRMLTNILYAGYIDYTKTTRDRKTGLIKKAWHISLRKAKHEGLISLETYYKIQERMKKKAPYKIQIKKVHEDFPLR
jgi:site-specific DNA recombinase